MDLIAAQLMKGQDKRQSVKTAKHRSDNMEEEKQPCFCGLVCRHFIALVCQIVGLVYLKFSHY